MKPSKYFAFVLALLFSTAAEAQDITPYGRDPQAPVTLPRWQGNLSDFKTMEVLCKSSESGDYISTALCTLTLDEARSAGRDLNMNVLPSAGRDRDDSVTLFVHITSAGRAPRAITARVEVSRYYEKAVDKAAMSNDAAASPRRGKLVMFEDTLTGVGYGDNLESNMKANLRATLQRLFARMKNSQD